MESLMSREKAAQRLKLATLFALPVVLAAVVAVVSARHSSQQSDPTPAPTHGTVTATQPPALDNSCLRWVYANDMDSSVCDGYDGSFPSCADADTEWVSACVFEHKALCSASGADPCPLDAATPYLLVFRWDLFFLSWRSGLPNPLQGVAYFPRCATEDSRGCVFPAGSDRGTVRGPYLLTFMDGSDD